MSKSVPGAMGVLAYDKPPLPQYAMSPFSLSASKCGRAGVGVGRGIKSSLGWGRVRVSRRARETVGHSEGKVGRGGGMGFLAMPAGAPPLPYSQPYRLLPHVTAGGAALHAQLSPSNKWHGRSGWMDRDPTVFPICGISTAEARRARFGPGLWEGPSRRRQGGGYRLGETGIGV